MQLGPLAQGPRPEGACSFYVGTQCGGTFCFVDPLPGRTSIRFFELEPHQGSETVAKDN